MFKLNLMTMYFVITKFNDLLNSINIVLLPIIAQLKCVNKYVFKKNISILYKI